MVDWHDPINIQLQLEGHGRLVHFFCGIFMWEFVSTFSYDWAIYTRKRPWKWTMILYLSTRWLTVGLTCAYIIGFNMNAAAKFDCAAWLTSTYVVGYSAIAAASFMLALRGIALWGRHLGVSLVLVSAWSTHVGFLVYGISRGPFETKWDSLSGTCLLLHTYDSRFTLAATFASDSLLLAFMLLGVRKSKNAGELWKLIYRQGMVWTAFAVFSEIPSLVLIYLNLNDAMNLMLQPIAVFTLAIGATRLYRDLAEHGRPLQVCVNTDVIRFASGGREEARGVFSPGVNDAPKGLVRNMRTDIFELNNVPSGRTNEESKGVDDECRC